MCLPAVSRALLAAVFIDTPGMEKYLHSHLKSLTLNPFIMCLYSKGKGLLLERRVYMTLIG